MLRPHTVIDRGDHRSGPAAEVAGNEIMRIKTADDVAAAVKIDDGGHRRCRLVRPVEAHASHSPWAGEKALLDLGDRKRLGLACARGSFHLLARFGGGHLFDRPKPCLGRHLEDVAYLRVKLCHLSPGRLSPSGRGNTERPWRLAVFYPSPTILHPGSRGAYHKAMIRFFSILPFFCRGVIHILCHPVRIRFRGDKDGKL